ncbi:hypothetical protein OG338_29540 (plasmid) [Streptomyces sp. NBC_00726]|uniref:hypothetical protein n=1 Tax=Streptomyces sp. NBC_00726 TaxID=2903674 RepID=UPI002F918D3E
MTSNQGPSPHGPDSAYDHASIYVDAVAAPRILGRLQDALSLKDHREGLAIGPVRVHGEPNDYATDRRAHPFDFMEWPTVLECAATAGAPAEVVKAVTSLLETLWHEGFKAIAACDFEDELPARGGMDRYPLPVPAHDGSSVKSWWKNLSPSGRKRKKL